MVLRAMLLPDIVKFLCTTPSAYCSFYSERSAATSGFMGFPSHMEHVEGTL